MLLLFFFHGQSNAICGHFLFSLNVFNFKWITSFTDKILIGKMDYNYSDYDSSSMYSDESVSSHSKYFGLYIIHDKREYMARTTHSLPICKSKKSFLYHQKIPFLRMVKRRRGGRQNEKIEKIGFSCTYLRFEKRKKKHKSTRNHENTNKSTLSNRETRTRTQQTSNN